MKVENIHGGTHTLVDLVMGICVPVCFSYLIFSS